MDLIEGVNDFREVDDHADSLVSRKINSKFSYQVLQDHHSTLPDTALRYWEQDLGINLTDDEWISFLRKYKDLKRVKVFD